MKVNRLKKSYRKTNVLNWLKGIIILIFIFTITILVYIYAYSHPFSIFPIKNVLVDGNKHLSDEEIVELAGIKTNESLIKISNKEISRTLLESPWIKSVSIRKKFPDTLFLAVEEVEPLALLDVNGYLFLVDDRGRFLEEFKDNPIPFLPVITGDPFKEKEGFSEALKLARLMNDKGFSSERDCIEIIIKKPHELTVRVDGTVIKIGAGTYEDKLTRFIEIEEEVKRRGITVDYIDLRFANKAVVKPINKQG
ncbi:MAG: FtsQ-type POTRA domain-containing protein [Nitrospirota bacterium]